MESLVTIQVHVGEGLTVDEVTEIKDHAESSDLAFNVAIVQLVKKGLRALRVEKSSGIREDAE